MAAARFQTTNWSLVFAAGGSPDALNDLCARYWSPVYAYVRRCGCDRADAEDLTQAFFSRMLEHRDLAQADPRRGKFRSFLDRKSTRLNSSHVKISYAVFCLKKKK